MFAGYGGGFGNDDYGHDGFGRDDGKFGGRGGASTSPRSFLLARARADSCPLCRLRRLRSRRRLRLVRRSRRRLWRQGCVPLSLSLALAPLLPRLTLSSRSRRAQATTTTTATARAATARAASARAVRPLFVFDLVLSSRALALTSLPSHARRLRRRLRRRLQGGRLRRWLRRWLPRRVRRRPLLEESAGPSGFPLSPLVSLPLAPL